MNTASEQTPFAELSPDAVLQAVESCGLITNGRILALNSYENRVYQVGIEEAEPVIVKFYRPHRWSKEQIQEEHDFTYELLEQDISVVPPVRDESGNSILQWGDMRFAQFPRRG